MYHLYHPDHPDHSDHPDHLEHPDHPDPLLVFTSRTIQISSRKKKHTHTTCAKEPWYTDPTPGKHDLDRTKSYMASNKPGMIYLPPKRSTDH